MREKQKHTESEYRKTKMEIERKLGAEESKERAS